MFVYFNILFYFNSRKEFSMRRIILLICFVLFCKIVIFATIAIPPGTITLDKKTKTYIDATETTVANWAEYLYWLQTTKGIQSEEYINALPDSATCEKLYGATRYFQHPKYKDYPIVGLTYEQAVNYCKWRTDRVNEITKKGKVTYSLPDVYDFQAAYSKQKNNKNFSLTIIPVNQKSKKITGIGYNVQEYTSDPNVILIGSKENTLLFDDFIGINHLLGFRCKAVKINNK